ncbi:uncharacterized protein LOC141600598 [Silene latifolia]|uniref:uncharacterized protein LOC141600598 n=1 Tax=Silene latifolia TaxID=37657 RepID=UPI003D77D20C
MLSKTVVDQLIHFKVHHHESCLNFHLSIVYGCNDPLDRHRLWSSLVAASNAEPWLVLGDFNVVITSSEKLSNTPPVLPDMLDFNDCLASCHLDDLTCTGVDMTWTNKQDSVTRVWSKLDRMLANPSFISSFPNAFGHFQEPGLSDHSPVLVQVSQDKKVVKRFSFLNSWVGHPDYLPTINAAWITPLQGSPINISQRVQSAKNALMECQQKLASNPFSDILIQEERLLIADYSKLKDHEFSILSQRAKIKDIHDSDCSSKYFFVKISERTNQQDLLGHNSPTTPLDTTFISSGAVVNSSDSHFLIREISPTEIRDALFSMDSNSSPGIDGFSAGFFKSARQIIAKDFCKAVNQFFSSGKMSKQANSTVISLIPKKAIANVITDYRPISCCTVFYKTVNKILANRLQSILPSIVGAEQAAFIKGRSIFENIMLSQTLVDIRKAFDSLQWSFIANMLSGLGFPQQFIGWVLGCIQTPWYSLKINGELSGFFQGKSGIRQGDPLSPYLFVLSMEVISTYLRTLCDKPLVSYHPKCSRLKLNNLIFADDLMVFVRGDVPSIAAVKSTLSLFAELSGLHANIEKTNIYFGGVHSDGIPFEGRRMVFKKWKDICLPWDAGGFNIKDLSTWNDALQCRWLYLLAHTTVGSWDSFSSSLKGILTVRDRLVALAGSITNASSLINSWCSHGKFRVTADYSYLRGVVLTGPWTKALTHPRIVPSHRIICSLAAQQKLATVDNMQHRGLYMMNRCSLCEVALEDHAHLFFNCSFSKDIWQQLLQWMGINRAGSCLLAELEQAGMGSKQNWRMAWFRTSLAAAVYQVWNERNSRLFRGRKAAANEIVRKVKFLVSTRLLMWTHHKQYLLIVASL